MADADALPYVASGTYSMKAALDSTAGVGSVTWSITSADDAHVDSLPTVTPNSGDKTCTFSVPKTGGAWLLQCRVNGGVNQATGETDTALVKALAVKVLNSAGQQEVAVGEVDEAGTHGWTKAFNDVARAATSGGSGTLSAPTVIYRQDGVASGIPGVYHTFALAVAAAQAIPGVVDLVIDPKEDAPALTGTHDLQRRIRLVAMAYAGVPLPLNIDATGAVFQNPVYVGGLAFTGTHSASLFTTTDGDPHDLTLDRCTYTESANSADWIALTSSGSGAANKIRLRGRSALDAASHALFTLTSTKHVDLFVEDGAVGAEVVGGSAGTLTAVSHDAGTLHAQINFSGTASGTRTVLETLAGGADPVDVNNQRITNVSAPSSGTDAANKTYADGVVTASRVLTALAAATGDVAVNGQKITGVATPGASTDAANKDYVDTAVAALSSSGSAALYGAGVNGAATISGNTTLTEAKQYTTLAVDAAISLAASGYSVDARTSITIGAGGAIHNDGTTSTGQAGAASGNTGQLGGTVGTGGNGGSNGGGAVGCGGSGSVSNSLGGNSGGGGAASWPGGSACTANLPNGSYGRMCLAEGYYLLSGVAQKIAGGASGSGGSSGASGQAGGGGGGGGGVLLVRAPSITLASGARISCNGGAGGNAVGTNAGGGGGGGGGVLIVICDTLTKTGSYADHFKCDGGAAGTGTGTGAAGTAGSAGRVFVIVGGRLVYASI